MSKRRHIEVFFEHQAHGYIWRGVVGINGGHRVEKRGVDAKSFKVLVWGGRREDLIDSYGPNGVFMQPKYNSEECRRRKVSCTICFSWLAKAEG